jgi:hypothetical protein
MRHGQNSVRGSLDHGPVFVVAARRRTKKLRENDLAEYMKAVSGGLAREE